MKIKQVCDRTGLTERTVRYYIERGIISPTMTEQNDRTYYDFSEKDIETLETVTVLRNTQFSLEEIILFLKEPSAIRKTVYRNLKRLEEENEHGKEVLEKLSKQKGTYFKSAKALADAIEKAQVQKSEYVPEPDFGRVDGEIVSEDEKQEAIDKMNEYLDSTYTYGGERILSRLYKAKGLFYFFLSSVVAISWHKEISLILGVLLEYTMLCLGYRWIKWGVIIENAMLTIASVWLIVLYLIEYVQEGLWFLDVLFVIFALISVTIHGCITVLLLVNKSVKEFLRQKGRERRASHSKRKKKEKNT